jgi:high-affinity K+ transport system ATPase subunit B
MPALNRARRRNKCLGLIPAIIAGKLNDRTHCDLVALITAPEALPRSLLIRLIILIRLLAPLAPKGVSFVPHPSS